MSITEIIHREGEKFQNNWQLYVWVVIFFCFFPVTVQFLFNSYYPFNVSEARIQPFPVVEDVIAPGGTVTYLVDVDKKYPFSGTVNRYLQSDKCAKFEPINPAFDSNRPVGRLNDSTTITIPPSTVSCPYRIVIQTVYHPTFLRSLPPVIYTTDEFLVTDNKVQVRGEKAQVDILNESIEDGVINEKGDEP